MTPNPTTKGMSEAEVLAVLRSHAANLRSVADECKRADLAQAMMIEAVGLDYVVSTIESTFADRTALLEVVRRLLPYAEEFAANAAGRSFDEAHFVVLDAEAILSRITESGASR